MLDAQRQPQPYEEGQRLERDVELGVVQRACLHIDAHIVRGHQHRCLAHGLAEADAHAINELVGETAAQADIGNIHQLHLPALGIERALVARGNEINKDIESALGARGRTLLGVATLGPHARTLYALSLVPGRIEFI